MIRHHLHLAAALGLAGCSATSSAHDSTAVAAVMSPDGYTQAPCAALALDTIDAFKTETQEEIDQLETQYISLSQAWLDSHPEPELPDAEAGALNTPEAPDQMRGEAALAEGYTAYLDTDPTIDAIRTQIAGLLDRADPSRIYAAAYFWAMGHGDYQAAECVSVFRDTPAAATILDDSCYESADEALAAQAAIEAAQDAALAAPDGRPDPNTPAFLGGAGDDPPFEDEPKKCIKPAAPAQPPPVVPKPACPAPVIEFANANDDSVKVGCKAVIVLGTPDNKTNRAVYLAPTPASGAGTEKKEWCEPLPPGQGENDMKRTADSLMKYSWNATTLGFAYSSHAGTFDDAMNKQQEAGKKRPMQGCTGTWPAPLDAAAKGRLGGGLKVKPFVTYVPMMTFDPRKGKFVENTANLPAALTSRGKIVGPSCDPYVYAFGNFSINENVSFESAAQMFTIPSRYNEEANQNYLAHSEANVSCWSTANTGSADDPQVLTADAKITAEIIKDCKVEVSESTTTSAEISGNVGGSAGGKDGPMKSAGFGASASVSKTHGKAHSCQTKTWEADSWEEAAKSGEGHAEVGKSTASCKAIHGTPMRQAGKIEDALVDKEITIPGPDGQPKKVTIKVYKPLNFFGSSTLMAGFQLEGIQTKAATTWGNVNKRGWVKTQLPWTTIGPGYAFSYSYAGLATLFHQPFVKDGTNKPKQKSEMSILGTNCEVYHFQFNDFSKIWERVQTGVPIKTPPGGDNAKKEWPVAVRTTCEIAEPVKREYWMFKPVEEALTEQIPDPKF